MAGKYVIWGCGARGQYLYEVLKAFFPISFFIDQRKAQTNKTYDGVPILSFEAYLQSDMSLPIIITPRANKDIVLLLEQNYIKNYILMDDILGFANEPCRPLAQETERRIPSKEEYELSCVVVSILQKTIKTCCTHFLIDNQRNKFCDANEMINVLLQAEHPVIDRVNEAVVPFYKTLVNGDLYPLRFGDLPNNTDLLLVHGLPTDFAEASLIQQAKSRHIPIVLAEEGFIRSIVPAQFGKVNPIFQIPHSGIFDSCGFYINANLPSSLEKELNSSNELSPSQLKRARNLIQVIVGKHISKYNFHPAEKLIRSTGNRKQVLVIDQVYGDKSIEFGQADENTFCRMLDAAIAENPNSDILIKTHPASTATKGYYTDLEVFAPINKISTEFNPIALLEQVDKVYVCTSQMGFEALMCGKEVHVFGMPFYAGWGVTHDRLHCPRRTKKRTIEEIFYAAYIKYSMYVSYKTNSVCEIEQAIDELLELREEYWAEQAKK